jgi:xylulokinase
MEPYSKPIPMGTVLGKVRRSLMEELGLKRDVCVIVGGHDQPVNAIGSGLRDGYAVNSMGTSECITPIINTMLPGSFITERGIPSEPLWDKGKFCCLAYNSTSGLLVQWYTDLVASEHESPFTYLDEHIPAEPTRIMVQPYLMGSGTPYMDAGARLALAGIDYGANKFSIYRAILEGLVLDQRLNLSVLAEEQVSVKHIIAVGGGSKSMPWLQIKADILEIPVSTLKVKEAGALGCAILCATTAGIYSNINEAAVSMSHITKTIEPDLAHHDFYAEKFTLYRKLRDHVNEESNFAI